MRTERLSRKTLQAVFGIGLAVILATAFATRDSWLMANLQKFPKSTIGPTGGSVPFLNFTIVGDTRPSKVDG